MGNSAPHKAAPHNGSPPADELVQYANKGVGGHTFSDCTKEFPIVFAEKGPASAGMAPSCTIMDLMAKAVELHGKDVALRVEDLAGMPPPDLKKKTCPPPLPLSDWKTWTWSAYNDECRQAAKGMMKAGLVRFDGVNIFGFNSPEWFIGEMGAMFAGGIAAGIYPSDTPAQVAFKSSHSNSSIACVQSLKQVNCFKKVLDDIPYMKAIVCWGPDFAEANAALIKDGLTRTDGTKVAVMSWDQLLASGKAEEDAALEARLKETKPGNVCAYIYTSGTTGQPKAVMMTHDNMVFEGFAANKALNVFGLDGEERVLSYLPLSHVAGMLMDIIFPLCITSSMATGYVTSNFARYYDLKIGKAGIIDRLGSVKPTMFLGVPRVWEKFAEAMQAVGAKIAAKGGIVPKISGYGKGKMLAYQKNMELGGSGSKSWGHWVGEAISKKAKGGLGLGKMKFAMTGAAPIKVETLEYFASIGIQINEVYGMSECAGACTMSTDRAHLWGSCGYPMPGVEVKIMKVQKAEGEGKLEEIPRAKDIFKPTEAEQGEICFRGRNNMAGYMANPKLGEEHVKTILGKNASAIDNKGWLHSGDKGCMGEHGFVKITGRYKELIIGAGGENIAPVPIEDAIKACCPAISNIMMVGDKRKFNTCVITLKAFGTGESPGGQDLEPAAQLAGCKTIRQAMESAEYTKIITQAIIATNKNGDVCPSNASKIQKFTILPIDVSVDGDELTATLKLKRSVVAKKYAEAIERMYDASVPMKQAFVMYTDKLPALAEAKAEDAKKDEGTPAAAPVEAAPAAAAP